MACEIKYNQEGKAEVQTYKTLYKELLNYTENNQDEALNLYALTQTQEFQDLGIQKPTMEQVLSFNNTLKELDSESLTKEDKILLLNISPENFLEAFTSKDNQFEINPKKLLESRVLTREQILYLVNSIDMQQYIQEVYNKVQKDDTLEFNNIISHYNIYTSNPFDKLNPDIVKYEFIEKYIGLKTEMEIIKKAEELRDERVLENHNLSELILRDIQGKTKLVSYETDEYNKDVQKKQTNNTLTTLSQTLDIEANFEPLLQQIEFLKEQPISVFAEYFDVINSYVQNIEYQGSLIGLSLDKLSEVLPNRNYNQTIEFLDKTYNFLQDVQLKDLDSLSESLQDYTKVYDEYLQIKPQFKSHIIENFQKKGIFLHLETQKSEQELFNEHSLIKTSDNPNIYQKVDNTQTLDELKELIYKNPTLLPQDTYSAKLRPENKNLILQDITEWIDSQSRDLLNDKTDADILRRIVAIKLLTNNSPKEKEQAEPNVSYGKEEWNNPDDFLVKFNKYLLQNPEVQNLFFFSGRGLEAKINLGEYSQKYVESVLPESLYEALEEYAVLSQNESLQPLVPKYETYPLKPEILRNFYVNHPENLSELSTPYRSLGTTIIVENIVDPFIKVKGQIYEQLQPNVYELIKTDSRYKNYNLPKPTLTLENLEDYLPKSSEETTKEIEIKPTQTEELFC